MKKIVLLSFFSFGFVMADEVAVDGALAANEQISCEASSADAFNGFYAGLGFGVGRVKHEVAVEKSVVGNRNVSSSVKTIDENKTGCDGEILLGYGRSFKGVHCGLEVKCGVGGKYKINDGNDFEKNVKAFRPGVFAKIGGLVHGEVLAHVKAGAVFTKTEWVKKGVNAFSKDCSGGQFTIGCGAEKQVSQIGSRRIFGRIDGEYAFGKRKYVNGANGTAYSGKTSRAMVGVSAVIR